MANGNLSGEGLITSATGGTSGTGEVRVSFSRGSIKYDSPFLDMTSTFLPKTIKGMLRFIAVYVIGDGFVSQCITKMSEYPITRLIYNDDEEAKIEGDKTIDKWKDILEKHLKIVRSMKQAGMDYHAYGNSIVSINYPFKRMLKCPRCKQAHAVESLKGVKFRGFKFYADCRTKKCRYKGRMEAEDKNTKEYGKLGLVHWDLQCINIKYNSITGDHFYFYSVPKDLATKIRLGDLDIINNTRLEVIDAVRRKKMLKLMADNVFHLKRPAPQYLIPSERGWGIPAILPVMKDIFHIKILKKGNEMIAYDHIVPLRILFPQATGDVSPHATIHLGSWKTKIEDEVRAWRRDPNRVSIVPIPIGMQNFSGDSKILMVTPEIKATEDSVITGFGIIPEIIRGGASWSGSNVSLRVVENSFLNHRTDMHAFLDFVIENIARFIDKPVIKVKMADFKMADDMQKKRLIVEAALRDSSQALVSKPTVTKELGFDPVEEFRLIKEDLKKRLELVIQEAEGQAEAQGAAIVLNAMYQADAQMEGGNRLEMHQRDSQAKRDEFASMEREENATQVDEEVTALAQKKGLPPNQITLPNLILILTQRFARLAHVDMDEFKIRMLAMKNSMPALYHEVYNNLKEMNLIQADTMPDLAEVQKMTPGQIPLHAQGDTHAEEPPGGAEAGASPQAVAVPIGAPAGGNSRTGGNGQYGKPLPQQKPPVSQKAPI